MNSFKKAGGETLVITPAKVTLPTERRKPKDDIASYAYIIYGERGIGKTTLASQFGKIFFCMFESDRTLEVFADDIQDWGQFIDYTEVILAGGHDYTALCVDNGSMAYESAMEYACKLHGFDHPGGQNDHGQAWAKVKKVFYTPFRKLLNSQYGLIVTAHQQEKEIETRGGRKFVLLRPDWGKQPDSFLGAFVENIFYYYYRGSERWLQIVGDEYVTAKVKFKNHFFTPSGERIHNIPMGSNEVEAYENLLKAFRNEQEDPYIFSGKENLETSTFKRS